MAEPTLNLGHPDEARSWLFVPGDTADHMLANAARAPADVIVLDLEDSVAPSRKDEARDVVGRAIASVRPAQPVMIRINRVGSPWWQEDVDLAIRVGVAAIMIPKASGVDDLNAVWRTAGERAESRGISLWAGALVPLIESAAGVLHSEVIAAVPGVVAVALGGEDLAADLSISPLSGGAELVHARSHIALACSAAGRPAIDAPALDPANLGVVAAEAETARAAGFSGKLAIHPRQTPVINAAFEPPADQIRWARAVIEVYEAASLKGAGTAVLDGRMVDRAVVALARRLLARTRMLNEGSDR